MRHFKRNGLATIVCVGAMAGLFTVLCAADGPSGALSLANDGLTGNIAEGPHPVQMRTNGDLVQVTVSGTVFFNGVGDPPLGDVQPGDAGSLSFRVHPNEFVDGVENTRGYVIDQSSFVLMLGMVEIGLEDPFPDGETPYFTLADGIPISDRFWVSTSPDSPGGVPLAQDPIEANVDLGYVGETLNSLEILDALGTYDFDGLTSFAFNLWAIFPDNVVLGLDFEQMTIAEFDDRITICHIPRGNPENARTITISMSALPAHLAHGDTIGPCEPPPFEDCGNIVQGVECVLFEADTGGLYLLDDLGGFGVGDRVFVSGILDPDCFTICLEGDGCIFENTIGACP